MRSAPTIPAAIVAGDRFRNAQVTRRPPTAIDATRSAAPTFVFASIVTCCAMSVVLKAVVDVPSAAHSRYCGAHLDEPCERVVRGQRPGSLLQPFLSHLSLIGPHCCGFAISAALPCCH